MCFKPSELTAQIHFIILHPMRGKFEMIVGINRILNNVYTQNELLFIPFFGGVIIADWIYYF